MTNTFEPIILFEDQDLLVINKPPSLIVNRAQTTSEFTLQDWLAKQVHDEGWGSQPESTWSVLVPADFSNEFGEPKVIFDERLGLVHRLDKDTSGVLILAKNPGSLVSLLQQFKQRTTQKEYQALCHGKFSVERDTISLPLGRASHNRQLFSVKPEGKPAVTEYQVEQFYPGLDVEAVMVLPSAKGSDIRKKAKIYQGFSLLRCWPHTGRTHQIRVHLAHVKHPLVGDSTYVGKKRKALDEAWCPRHFLHAAKLTVRHPRTNENITFEAPLTPDLAHVLELLRNT